MFLLEIIRLRLAWKGSAPLGELLDSISKVEQSGLVNMKIYRHAALETDLSVHLCWKSDQPGENGSPLGLHLGQALREFGLVDHSVWIEDKK
jgi:hypothetical protein